MHATEVLVIDELCFPRLIIKNSLTPYNVKVYEAKSLFIAFEIFMKVKPAVVVFGASMNDEASRNLAKIFREHCNGVKITFVFNKASRHSVAEAFSSGANHILLQPLKKERLLEVILPRGRAQEYALVQNF